MRWLVPTFFLLLAAASGVAAAPVASRVRLEPTGYYIGSPARLHVEITGPADLEIESGKLSALAGEVDGGYPAPVRRSVTEEGVRYDLDIDLMSFELGEGSPVTGSLKVTTGGTESELTLWLPGGEVIPVPARASDREGHLRAAKGVVALPPSTAYRWFLLALLGPCLWLAWRRLRAVLPVPAPVPPELAFPRALRLLAGLEASGDGGDPRSFHYRLSEILREYLSARYGLSGLSETTYELVQECRRSQLDSDLIRRIQGLLGDLDLVKFGPEDAPREQSPQNLAGCQELVRSTEPAATQPSPPATTGPEC